MKTAAHFIQLFAADAPIDAPVPERIHLLPAGEFKGVDGRGPYRVADMAALIAASQAGPLIIDIGHATDKDQPYAPAVGRIVGLEAEASGLWGRVVWNDRGRNALTQREYFGISPVITHAEDGTVTRLLRASLTNIPNLTLTTLNSQEPTMTVPADLLAALGLAATADLPAAVAHAKALAARDKAATEAHTALCSALKLDPAKADGAALLTAVQSAQAAPAPQDAALRAEHEALKREVETLKAANVATQAEAAVDAAINARKAAPAEREHLVTTFAALGAEKFAAAMAARPEILPAPGGNPGPASSGAEDPTALGLRAASYRAMQSTKGINLTATEAVMHCQQHPEAGK